MSRVREADLAKPAEAAALVELLDSYARGPGGQNAPLSDAARRGLAEGLRGHPGAFVLFAIDEESGAPVGAAVCFRGYSTFAARPLLNVHDLVVLPAHQNRGIGRSLLAEVERRARAEGCCKITLEVHDGNERAKHLYRSVGFGPWEAPQLSVTKGLGE